MVDEGGCGRQKRDVCRYVYGRVQAIGKTCKRDLLRCLPTCVVPGFGALRKLDAGGNARKRKKRREYPGSDGGGERGKVRLVGSEIQVEVLDFLVFRHNINREERKRMNGVERMKKRGTWCWRWWCFSITPYECVQYLISGIRYQVSGIGYVVSALAFSSFGKRERN